MQYNLGEKLIQLRKQNNMSQEELSKKLNISRQAISNWERNKTQPDIYTLQNICAIFNIEINSILGTDSSSYETKSYKQPRHLSTILYLINASLSLLLAMYILAISTVVNRFIGLCFLVIAFIGSTIIFITFERLLSNSNFSLINSFTRGLNLNKNTLKKLLYSIELFYLTASLALALLIFIGVIFNLSAFYNVLVLFAHLMNFIFYILFINLKLKNEIQLSFDTIEVKNQYKNLFVTLLYAVAIIATPFIFLFCIFFFDINNKGTIFLLMSATIILNIIGLFFESSICTKHTKLQQNYKISKYTFISLPLSFANWGIMILVSYLNF